MFLYGNDMLTGNVISCEMFLLLLVFSTFLAFVDLLLNFLDMLL